MISDPSLSLPELPPEEFTALFQKAMDASVMGMILVSVDRRWRKWNAALSRFLGYTEEEFKHVRFEHVTTPGDILFYYKGRKALLAGEIPFYQGEKRYVRKDGSLVWGSLVVTLVHDALGTPKYFFAQVENIDARKKKEAEAQVNAGRWKFALESSGQGIYDRDYVTNRVFFSAGYLAILGYNQGEWTDSPLEWTTRIHPDDYDRVLSTDIGYLEGKTPGVVIEYRLRAKDGSYRWVQDRGRVIERDAQGNYVRMVGTHVDITARKLAEEKLAESESLFRNLMESSTVGMVIDTVDGTRVKANAALARMFGYTPEEFATISTFDISFPEDIPELQSQREALVRGEIPFFQRERRYIHKDGRVVWALANVNLMRDADGRPLYFIGQVLDITERKHADQLLQRTKEEAEKANRAKSDFLAMMSHEIRTPMNGVLGFSELLRATTTSEQQKDYVDTIVSSGGALLRIIDDILDFSRIESGQVGIEPSSIHLAPVVNEVAELLRPQAERKGIEMRAEIDGEFPAVVGDAGRLRQVLLNLAGNAVKFTARGSVTIRLEILARTAETVEVEFVVRDTGDGIPEEKIREIFEPFKQADSSVTRRYGGTGLGLAISQRLVSLMGGTLTAESTLGEGSVFRCRLTFSLATENARPGAVQAEPFDEKFATRHPLRILVSEDDPTSRKLIQRVLSKLGYTPLVASNGRAAVEMFQKHSPNLVLMDMQMPEVDGLEATRLIREIERSTGARPCYISALTANVLANEIQDCLAAGMNGHLSKPLRLEALSETLVFADYAVRKASADQ